MKNHFPKTILRCICLILLVIALKPKTVFAEYNLLEKFGNGGVITYSNVNSNYGVGITENSKEDFFVAGSVKDKFSGDYSAVLWKYDINGNLLQGFPKTYDSGNGPDVLMSIAVNTKDEIYASGFTTLSNGRMAAALFKYDINGDLINGFPKIFNYDLSYHIGSSIICDEDNNVYMVGTTKNLATLWIFDQNDELLESYPRFYGENFGYASAKAVNLNLDNKLYILGDVSNDGINFDVALWTFNNDRHVSHGFPRIYDSGRNDKAGYALSINDDNVITFTGSIKNEDGNDDLAVWRYSSRGELLRNYPQVHDSGRDDFGWGIANDQAGNFLISGNISNASGFYDAALWRLDTKNHMFKNYPRVFDNNGDDYANTILLSRECDAYIAGYSDNTNGEKKLFVLKYYDPASHLNKERDGGVTLYGKIMLKGNVYTSRGKVKVFTGSDKMIKEVRVKGMDEGKFQIQKLEWGKKYTFVVYGKERISGDDYEKLKGLYHKRYSPTMGDRWYQKFTSHYQVEIHENPLPNPWLPPIINYYRIHKEERAIKLFTNKKSTFDLR